MTQGTGVGQAQAIYALVRGKPAGDRARIGSLHEQNFSQSQTIPFPLKLIYNAAFWPPDRAFLLVSVFFSLIQVTAFFSSPRPSLILPSSAQHTSSRSILKQPLTDLPRVVRERHRTFNVLSFAYSSILSLLVSLSSRAIKRGSTALSTVALPLAPYSCLVAPGT